MVTMESQKTPLEMVARNGHLSRIQTAEFQLPMESSGWRLHTAMFAMMLLAGVVTFLVLR